MGYKDFLATIKKAGLTVQEFARLLKMNRISVSNYAAGKRVPSHLAVIATLLAAMTARNIDFYPLLNSLKIAPRKPRGSGLGKFGGDRQNRLF